MKQFEIRNQSVNHYAERKKIGDKQSDAFLWRFCSDFQLLYGASLSIHIHTMLILNAARLRGFEQHWERVFLALITKIHTRMFQLMHCGRCEAVRQLGGVT
jgi:hypothetical protein